MKVELRMHLTAHAKERPEDFEEVEQRPASLALQAKTRDSKVLTYSCMFIYVSSSLWMSANGANARTTCTL